MPLGASVPDPETFAEEADRTAASKALEYMALQPGQPMREIAVDTVFLGSCTNGRIEDLRAAADVIKGHHVADSVRMLVVPGSARVRLQAEAEGLDVVFKEAGAEWRAAGCSMCLGMNPDQLAPGERAGVDLEPQLRGPAGQGRPDPPGLPLVAAATAVTGKLSSPAGPVRRVDTRWTSSPAHRHRACRLRRSNVDTDQIIPAVYLKRVTKTGFEDGLFAAWRNRPDFVLNQPQYAGATILVPGPDFGTGSSREHAVWALQNYGFKVVIGSRFGDIFRGNSGKAGLLVAVVDQKIIEELWDFVEAHPAAPITVDLVEQQITADGIPDRLRDRRLHPLAADGGSGRHRSDPAPRRPDRCVRAPGVRRSSRKPCPPRSHRRPDRRARATFANDTTKICGQVDCLRRRSSLALGLQSYGSRCPKIPAGLREVREEKGSREQG